MSIFSMKAWMAATTAMGLATASPAQAQAPTGAPDEAAPQQAEDATGFGDIVVTAQRRQELKRDVPISITALTQDDLARVNITNATDLGRIAPGVVLPLYGAFILPSIRGISSNGSGIGDSPNVAVYVDGVYQASQSGMNLDLTDIQSVQILKGPQGSLYGQNAAGGAIIIDTIAPSFDWKGRLAVGYGSNDDKSANGYVTGPIAPTLAFYLSGAYRDRDGFTRDLVRGGHDNGLRTRSARAKLLWEPSDDASVTLTGFYNRHNDTGVYSNAALAGNSTGLALQALPCAFGGYACRNLPAATEPHTFATNITPDTRIRTYGFSARGTFDFADLGTISTLSAYNNTKAFNFNDTDGSLLNIVDFYLTIKEHDIVQEINFASEKFGAFTVNAGVFYLSKTETYDPYFAIVGAQPYSFYPSDYSPGTFVFGSTSKYRKRSYAAYLEVNFDITDQLQLTAAGRYSYEKALAFSSQIFGGYPATPPFPDPQVDARGSFTFKKFTPRFVLRYKPNDDNTLYASYSKGFKSGYIDTSNVNNNGCFNNANNCTNPPVRPEVVTAFEAGYKGKIGGILDLSLAGFHYKYKDIQIFSFSPPNSSFYQNAASAKINGVEFAAALQATNDLTLSFNGTYLDAKYKSFPAAVAYVPNGFGNSQVVIDAGGNPLMRTPKWTLNGGVVYSHESAAGTIGASVNASYNSGMTFDVGNRVRQGKYALLDAELSFAPKGLPGLRIVAWGKNLTDHDYLQSVLESQLGDGGSYADPRTYGVRLEYTF